MTSADVWLTGEILNRNIPVLLNWNGSSWRRIALPPHLTLTQVTTDGHGGVWMIGYKGGKYFFMHYSHGRLARQQVPTAGLPGVGSGAVDFDVYSIARIPGTTSLWATGDAFYYDADGASRSYTLIFKYGA